MSTDWPHPFWIAHRGAGRLAPENTLAAFRLGARHGFRAFECDVKLSADGVPFLLHDDTLDRTTDARGRAGDRRWHELALCDAGSWHSAPHAGEPPASLAAVARFVRANGLSVNLEIKPTPGLEAETGREVAAAAARLWAGDMRPPLLSSFSVDALEAARRAEPSLPRALLRDDDRGDWTALADRLGCRALVAHHRLLDRARIDALHAAGLRAWAYTVNDAGEARRLREAGIDGLITDEVARFEAEARGG